MALEDDCAMMRTKDYSSCALFAHGANYTLLLRTDERDPTDFLIRLLLVVECKRGGLRPALAEEEREC